MPYSPHQLAYFAYHSTRRAAAGSKEKMASALLSTRKSILIRIRSTPHYLPRNPLSNRAILADEAGLGKTVEAGLPIAQRWMERNA